MSGGRGGRGGSRRGGRVGSFQDSNGLDDRGYPGVPADVVAGGDEGLHPDLGGLGEPQVGNLDGLVDVARDADGNVDPERVDPTVLDQDLEVRGPGSERRHIRQSEIERCRVEPDRGGARHQPDRVAELARADRWRC